PDGPLGRERHDLGRRKAALAQQTQHDRADRARGADDRNAQIGAHANSPNGRSGRIVSGPDSSKAVCSARTAAGTCPPAMTHEILIGEVAIISMFTPSAPRTVKTFAATPG